MSHHFFKHLCLAASVASLLSIAPLSVQAREDERDQYIQLLQKDRLNGIVLQDPEGIYNFYKARDFDSLWLRRDNANRDAGKTIKLLEGAWAQGLNPANYHVERLRELDNQKDDLSDPLIFEILMSDAVARYGRDLTGMRVSAYTLGEDRNSWSKGFGAEQLLTYIAEKDDPADRLQDLEPQNELYQKLKKELEEVLTDIRENPEKPLKPIAFPGLLTRGKTNGAIPVIRNRLGLDQPKKDKEFYDEDLQDAVEKFQAENGLKPDGVIGKRTINVLNQGRRYRLVQLLANLERLRWAGQLPDKYIMVNVPAQLLQAVERGKTEIEMPVIVGRPDWPTNSFKTAITGIRFNPSWYVPPTIKTKDLLPQLRRNPDVLAKKNIGLVYYTSDGAKPVDPRRVNWNAMTVEGLKNYGMIQNPGDDNPLGKIRVLMPNQYNIYLHDTNSPDLFVKDDRALSHGCIRLAEPTKVANFILGDNEDWSQERLDAILKKTNTIEVMAGQTIPVYIMYNTIWQDDDGKLVHGQDFYGFNDKLVTLLAEKGKLPVPLDKIQ